MKIFFIIFLTISFLNAHDILSQSNNPNKIGFFIGPTLSNVSIDFDNTSTEYKADNKNKTGFVAGASIDLLTSEKFTLYSELYFNRKNGESLQSGPVLGFRNKVKSTIDYISYNVSGRFDLAGKTVIPFVFAGPRIDFYLSDKIEFNNASGSGFENEISEKITRVGVGFTGGIGLEFFTGKNLSFHTMLQFSPSFYDIFKEDYLSANSNSFEFKIGTRF